MRLRFLSPLTNLVSKRFPFARILGASLWERFTQTHEFLAGAQFYTKTIFDARHLGLLHYVLVLPFFTAMLLHIFNRIKEATQDIIILNFITKILSAIAFFIDAISYACVSVISLSLVALFSPLIIAVHGVIWGFTPDTLNQSELIKNLPEATVMYNSESKNDATKKEDLKNTISDYKILNIQSADDSKITLLLRNDCPKQIKTVEVALEKKAFKGFLKLNFLRCTQYLDHYAEDYKADKLPGEDTKHWETFNRGLEEKHQNTEKVLQTLGFELSSQPLG